MKILPIKNLNFQKTSFYGLEKNKEVSPSSANNTANIISTATYEKSKLYTDGINELKNEVNLFPEDIEYRKNLLKNAGMSKKDYYKLRPIIGSAEIQKIMSDFNDSPDYYRAGEKMEFVKAGKIRANLHMHTLASDGFLSVRELLDKASHYANFVANKNPNAKQEPFVIGITDHDTTESAQEAIKIIASDPLKYKNLRVILGVEMTTYNNIGTDIVDYPTNTHVLAYGIDPNEEAFKTFIDNTKKAKFDITEKRLNDANKIYENIFQEKSDFSLAKVKDFSNPVKKGLLGMYKHVLRYVQTEFAVKEIALKDKEILKSLKENNLPVKTEEFMKGMEEYFYAIDKNNYMRKPQAAISEYLSNKTNISSEKITEIIEKGLQKPNSKKFYEEISAKFDEYKVTLNPKYDDMPTFATRYSS